MKINKKIIINLIGLTFIVANCQTLEKAKTPVFKADLSSQEKAEFYSMYNFHAEGNEWTGYNIYQGQSKPLDLASVQPVFASMSPEALKVFKEGESLNNVGQIFAGIGGVAIGWSLGSYLSSGQFTTTEIILTGGGAGVATLGIILSSLAVKKFNESIGIFNNALSEKIGIPAVSSSYISPARDSNYSHDPKYIDQKIYLTLASYAF